MKKVLCLLLTVLLLSNSAAFATDTSDSDSSYIEFNPSITNQIENSQSEWLGSSVNRAILTWALCFDLFPSHQEMTIDSLGTVFNSYVGSYELGIIVMIPLEEENAWVSILYIPLLGTASYMIIDAASAVSGCGPAFVCLFVEALCDGAVRCGVPRARAMDYATQTLLGTAKLLMETGKHPAVVKDEVTSPGGTTIAGIEALELGGFRHAIMDAVSSAYERTLELK